VGCGLVNLSCCITGLRSFNIRRPYSEAGTFTAGFSEKAAPVYVRIAQRGVNGGGYDALFGLLMEDLMHLARLPAEALAGASAMRTGTDAAPLPALRGSADHVNGVPIP